MTLACDIGEAAGAAAASRAYRRIAWRLLPFLMLCYTVAYLDRVNVGFAKLGMAKELGFSETAYGLGAGIFFIGYFFFEVPSNLMLHRLGAGRWIARIMVSWSIVSAACALVESPTSFYIVRFLLGVAEAGFFPGIVLYLTYWFPPKRRGQIVATFMVAIPVAGLVGGPVSGLVMDGLHGALGWSGWRWMFVIEALPALLLGLLVPFVLTSRPADAAWLSAEEKALVERELVEAAAPGPAGHARLMDILTDPGVLRFCAIYFCCVAGQYGVTFWLPTIVAGLAKQTAAQVGLLTAIPYACAVLAMVLLGRSSDRTGERRWHLAGPLLVGALGLALLPHTPGGLMGSLGVLCVVCAATLSASPLFWNLPTAALSARAAAAGLAGINSVGNLAGFASPFVIGWLNDRTGGSTAGATLLAATLVAGALGVLIAPGRRPA
jgi:MFS family permease